MGAHEDIDLIAMDRPTHVLRDEATIVIEAAELADARDPESIPLFGEDDRALR
jgi:hypothetical protein